ncbi:TetR/AcrR family transcriptional regulator [Auritidibacter ignavus]|uniref:TetR/AcrR family transcriptional regulator n=1 Tax=Auritidibacter ignavus TaxID=678932 RepID=UPI002449ECF3|nr:TetR/AcrR family transcriptional regulator [Auritidibacter ignavus]WGH90351.1 TetR/AcrR family transcriptional regulator [Auritidibacter ignavus]
MARRTDPEKHAARRQHILNSAAVLFAEQGYERTTTAQLCSQAGIGLGTLYHYFSGKKRIFLEVLTQDEQDTRALLDRLMSAPEPLEALLTFVAHLAEPATTHPIVPKLVLEAMLQAHRDSQVLEVLNNQEVSEAEGIKALLQRAAEAGHVDAELDLDEAAAWISSLIGALYLQAATHPDFDPATHQPHLIRSVRTFLRPLE